MRISQHQVDTIKRLARHVFGDDTKVTLFGSRANDALKGGDIDLYIQPAEYSQLFRKRLRFTSRLQMALGEQSFDIIIARNPERLIEQEAISKGIRL